MWIKHVKGAQRWELLSQHTCAFILLELRFKLVFSVKIRTLYSESLVPINQEIVGNRQRSIDRILFVFSLMIENSRSLRICTIFYYINNFSLAESI